ncbi:MAG: cytochrome c biogenesis protein CcsA [Candidatus Coatesbacteria bacterium]
MAASELAAFWAAVAAYAAAFLAVVFGLVLRRRGAVRAGLGIGAAGLAAQGIALTCRGIGQVAPPFVTYYESVVFGTMLATGVALWLARSREWFRPALAVVLGVSLLLMGSAVFTAREFRPLGPALQSWWLVVHVVFALFAFGGMLVAAGAGVVAIRRRAAPAVRGRIDEVMYRAFALSFIFQLVMTASGAIWAHQAWGRYWGWDPIETASLLTLIVYALALHLRATHDWRGVRLGWLAIAGFLLTAYGIWGVPFVSPSVHLYTSPAYRAEAK